MEQFVAVVAVYHKLVATISLSAIEHGTLILKLVVNQVIPLLLGIGNAARHAGSAEAEVFDKCRSDLRIKRQRHFGIVIHLDGSTAEEHQLGNVLFLRFGRCHPFRRVAVYQLVPVDVVIGSFQGRNFNATIALIGLRVLQRLGGNARVSLRLVEVEHLSNGGGHTAR